MQNTKRKDIIAITGEVSSEINRLMTFSTSPVLDMKVDEALKDLWGLVVESLG